MNIVGNMPLGGSMRNWICIRLAESGGALWTADLFDGYEFISNIGGSYPNVSQTIFDARLSWGHKLVVKVFPDGYPANIIFKGEI
jgi:hypothetical protein